MLKIGITKSKEALAGLPEIKPIEYGSAQGNPDLEDDFTNSFFARLEQRENYDSSVENAKRLYQNSIAVEPEDELVELGSWLMQKQPKQAIWDIPASIDDMGQLVYRGEEPQESDTSSAPGYLDAPGDSLLANTWNALPDEVRHLVFPLVAPFLLGAKEENPALKGVVIGTQKAAQGILDLGRDITNSLGGEFSEEDWIKIPQILDSNPDSTTEMVVSGFAQFMSVFGALGGMSKGATLFKQMWTGGVADALFDPEEGNIGTLLRELDIDNALTQFLDSKVGEDADALERLTARATNIFEGAGIGFAVYYLIKGIKALKIEIQNSDPELIPKVLERWFGIKLDIKSNIVEPGRTKNILSAKDFKRNKDGTYVGFSKAINTPQKGQILV